MKKLLKKAAGITLAVSLLTLPLTAGAASTVYSRSGTSSVWAGVPLIGHVFVCTPWTIGYTLEYYGKPNVKTVKTGQSYTSPGVALITYQAYDSWGKVTGSYSFDVFARGHCDLLFKGSSISLGLQTFVAHERIG